MTAGAPLGAKRLGRHFSAPRDPCAPATLPTLCLAEQAGTLSVPTHMRPGPGCLSSLPRSCAYPDINQRRIPAAGEAGRPVSLRTVDGFPSPSSPPTSTPARTALLTSGPTRTYRPCRLPAPDSSQKALPEHAGAPAPPSINRRRNDADTEQSGGQECRVCTAATSYRNVVELLANGRRWEWTAVGKQLI